MRNMEEKDKECQTQENEEQSCTTSKDGKFKIICSVSKKTKPLIINRKLQELQEDLLNEKSTQELNEDGTRRHKERSREELRNSCKNWIRFNKKNLLQKTFKRRQSYNVS